MIDFEIVLIVRLIMYRRNMILEISSVHGKISSIQKWASVSMELLHFELYRCILDSSGQVDGFT